MDTNRKMHPDMAVALTKLGELDADELELVAVVAESFAKANDWAKARKLTRRRIESLANQVTTVAKRVSDARTARGDDTKIVDDAVGKVLELLEKKQPAFDAIPLGNPARHYRRRSVARARHGASARAH